MKDYPASDLLWVGGDVTSKTSNNKCLLGGDVGTKHHLMSKANVLSPRFLLGQNAVQQKHASSLAGTRPAALEREEAPLVSSACYKPPLDASSSERLLRGSDCFR